MAQIIRVEISADGGPMVVDLDNFKGVGCEAVAKAFALGGKVIKDVKKPEYKAVTLNQVRK